MTCATIQMGGQTGHGAADLPPGATEPGPAVSGVHAGRPLPGSARWLARDPGARRLVLAVVGGLALAAVSVGGISVQVRPGAEAAVTPETVPQARPVTLFRVGAAPAQAPRSFIGRVAPKRTVDVAFQIPGQIVALPPEEGARVSAGSVIARLDPEDYRLTLARAEAMHALALADHMRTEELVERRVAPQAQLDQARAARAQAEVAVDQARRALEQTQITAPFDALVARRMAETWSNVTPAAPVLRLQDVTRFLVVISLPEELAARARLTPDAFEAVARFPALPGLELPLAPERFVTEADPVAQTYTVKFAVQGEDPRLLPGMTASVEIRSHAPQAGLMVPASAIDTGTLAPQVWVVDHDGAAHPRPVTLGAPQGDHIPVIQGLAPGDRIVATGWWQIEKGARVRPTRP